MYQQINLYSHYLKCDPHQSKILYDKEKASSSQIQARLDFHNVAQVTLYCMLVLFSSVDDTYVQSSEGMDCEECTTVKPVK